MVDGPGKPVHQMRTNDQPAHHMQEAISASFSSLASSTPIFLPNVSGFIPLSFKEADLKGTMTTKIFHPNVSKQGEICVDTLKREWKKEYGVRHVLMVCLDLCPVGAEILDCGELDDLSQP